MIVKNLLIPIIIVFMFGAGAAALMATAPQLDPEPVVPELLTVQVQEVLPLSLIHISEPTRPY